MYIYIVCDTCPRKKKKRKKKKEEERGKWEGKRAIRMNNTSGEENTARKGTVGLGKGLRYGTKEKRQRENSLVSVKKRKKNGWERRKESNAHERVGNRWVEGDRVNSVYLTTLGFLA